MSVYYHLGKDSLDELRININLKRVSRSTSTITSSESDVTHSTLKACILWQEKISGPRDIIENYKKKLSNSCDRDIEPSTVSVRNTNTNPSLQIGEIVDNKKAESKIPLLDSDMCIFTNVDKDFIVLPVQTKKQRSTHLEVAVQNLPVHNLHSRNTLSKSSAQAHDRILRDQPFKIMYIMAAVDCLVDELNDISQKCLERSIFPNDSLEYKNNQLKNLFHEEVLCVMKLYQNGILEVSPNFSTEEPENSDSPLNASIFSSCNSLHAQQKGGDRISSFCFTSLNGSVFRYSLERVDEIEDFEVFKRLSLINKNQEYLKLEQQKRKIVSKLMNIEEPFSDNRSPVRKALFLEIVSAKNFFPPTLECFNITNVSIAVQYDLVLPSGWKLSKDSIISKCDSIRVHHGATQQSKRSLEYKKRQIQRFILRLFLIIFLLEWLFIFKGNVGLTLLLIIIISISQGSLIGSGIKNNYGLQAPCHYFGFPIEIHKVKNKDDKTNLRNKEKQNNDPLLFVQIIATRNNNISSVVGYGFLIVPTQSGSYDINISTWKPVANKYMCELRYKMNDFYFGSSVAEYQFMKKNMIDAFVSTGRESSEKMSCFMKENGIVTVNSGSVRLRVQVATLPNPDLDTFKRDIKDEVNPLAVRETIDEVFSRIRRNKRQRDLKEIISSTSCENEYIDLIDVERPGDKRLEVNHRVEKNSRTEKVLKKIQARKAKRLEEAKQLQSK